MQRLDMVKVKEGVIREYFEANQDGSIPWVKLAYTGSANSAYQRRLEVASKPFRRKLNAGVMTEAEAQKLYLSPFCELIILAWGNVQPEDDGEELPFNTKNAVEFLGNPEYSPFYEWLQGEAAQLENYRMLRQETEAGN